MTDDPLFSVEGRVIVVTGACGLIGRTLVPALLARGATPVLIDIEAAHPVEAAAAVEGDATGIAVDVADSDQVSAAVKAVLDRHGRIDALVNGHQFKPSGFLDAVAETFSEELWDAVIDVNLKGTFLLCRDVGRSMLERGTGSIVNLASTYGIVSSDPGLYEGNSMGNPVAYSASKGGVVMLTRYIGAHWAGRGVRVNCLVPHGVWNSHEPAFEERFAARSPMRRMSRADEVVGAVVYLVSDASSYVTGSVQLVEGGWTAW